MERIVSEILIVLAIRMVGHEEAVSMELPRSARASRGKRMSHLVGEEAEVDEIFWNMDTFKEEVQDNDFEAKEDEEDEDVFDSDFDDDISSSEGEVDEQDDRRSKKKRLLPPGTKLSKDKKKPTPLKKRVVVSPEATDPSDEPRSFSKLSEPANDFQESLLDAEGDKTLRKSTRTAVIIKQAERDALRASLQSAVKPIKRKREGEERKITQEEMLLEAAQTEIMNRQNLERMLAREEEVKQKAITHKIAYTGPQIRYISRNGQNILEFTKVDIFPRHIFGKDKPYPEKPVCVVTGKPAKYIDPLTGLPYSCKESFKAIRQRIEELQPKRRTAPSIPWKRLRPKRSSSATNIVKYKLPDLSNIQFSLPVATDKNATNRGIGGNGGWESKALPETKQGVDPPPRISSTAQLPPPREREEANEADFMLDDLDIGLPLELSLPHSASRLASKEFGIVDSEPQLPLEDLHMADLDDMPDIL